MNRFLRMLSILLLRLWCRVCILIFFISLIIQSYHNKAKCRRWVLKSRLGGISYFQGLVNSCIQLHCRTPTSNHTIPKLFFLNLLGSRYFDFHIDVHILGLALLFFQGYTLWFLKFWWNRLIELQHRHCILLTFEIMIHDASGIHLLIIQAIL